MSKKILVDALHNGEIRVVVTHNNVVEELEYQNTIKKNTKGNIYLAKVTRVEPSLQAAFVDYGQEKHGFLPFAEIHPNYYQLPDTDKADIIKKLEEKRLASNEAVEDDNKSRKNTALDKYKIQEVVKKDQVILVQVDKEERGNKGAALTTYISLAGRYCVLMPNATKNGGISRKIQSEKERERLKSVLDEFYEKESNNVSAIVRTAGEGHNKADIKRDLNYLMKLWNNIKKHTLSSKAPTFIHEEGDVLRKAIRDIYSNEIDSIVVSGNEAFSTTRDFMTLLLPKHVDKVQEYTDKLPIFTKFDVEKQLACLYDSQATLKTGGYIVINHTEALISIDVNSGKSTGEKDIENTALRNNLEAAYEIARQIKLRDIAGLIVIDFIDMYEQKNKTKVENALKDALSTDRSRTQVSNISSLGLLEMSRQRLNSNFMESNTLVCPHCEGRGNVRPTEAIASTILRAIANEVATSTFSELRLSASHSNVLFMLNDKKEEIMSLEKIANAKIVFYVDEEAGPNGFFTETLNAKQKKKKNTKALSNIDIDPYMFEGTEEEDTEEKEDEKADSSKSNNKRNWAKGNVIEVENRNPNKNNRNPKRNNNRKNNRNRKAYQIKKSKKQEESSLLKKVWNKIIN